VDDGLLAFERKLPTPPPTECWQMAVCSVATPYPSITPSGNLFCARSAHSGFLLVVRAPIFSLRRTHYW